MPKSSIPEKIRIKCEGFKPYESYSMAMTIDMALQPYIDALPSEPSAEAKQALQLIASRRTGTRALSVAAHNAWFTVFASAADSLPKRYIGRRNIITAEGLHRFALAPDIHGRGDFSARCETFLEALNYFYIHKARTKPKTEIGLVGVAEE